ncbi:MAG: hypothetical protein PQ612_01530 [Rickettsiales bacterium]|nr:hypothetical protein [Pseudomonadota bacterium]MDA0965402.1 hypothetical protein [Pseudomonadota bacterium]MDG4542727.1 hypothetical protein [Rickettsiales bacterium]MDG4544825.1 hypothetical protein [Rickettsiales bacterium]MDG4546947.1 hypothetical protein [Rickettsiales bacterium]
MTLFGLKTVAWFDIWSIEHFLSGITVLFAARYISHRFVFSNKQIEEGLELKFYISYILCLCYMWEAVEFYLEAGYTNIDGITYWFQGVEFWGNRLITDPLLSVVGAILGFRFPILAWPARILCILWLLIHVFYFPHSMYLHELMSIN